MTTDLIDFEMRNLTKKSNAIPPGFFADSYLFSGDAKRETENRRYRQVIGVKISDDWGKTWKLRAMCNECVKTIEPPMQRRKLGVAGASCDWCGALSELNKK